MLLMAYVALLYVGGRFFRLFHAQLIGEILTGMIFGPPLLDIVPFPAGCTHAL